MEREKIRKKSGPQKWTKKGVSMTRKTGQNVAKMARFARFCALNCGLSGNFWQFWSILPR
jgi:hypothetical protein